VGDNSITISIECLRVHPPVDDFFPSKQHEGYREIEVIQALLPSLPQLAKDFRRDTTLEAPCYAGWYFFLILADGTTSPCCQCMGTMGSLRERSFPEIWKSLVYRQFREQAHMIPSRGRALEGCRCHDCALLPHNLAFHQAVFFYRPLNVLRFLRSDRQWRWKDPQKF
jgi:MoaA/NifB/PqqE/SkfB family radical SAM enzyme